MSQAAPGLGIRLARSLSARIRHVRGSPLLSPVARRARLAEQAGHPIEEAHKPHLLEAIDWLVRAQDATPDDGFARGYSLIWHPYFRSQGWQASYPETTGYIIPTIYSAARMLGRPDLANRATRAAQWEIAVQLENGAVQGGVIGQKPTPAIFNTGQVIFGWLAALEETGDNSFEDAVRRAGAFLVSVERDGEWIKGNSDFARKDATAYNARAAWALAEAGRVLHESRFTDAAARILQSVAASQHDNGWFPDCCLNDPKRPLLHTLAYTVRGMIEGGRVLADDTLLSAGKKAAAALAARVRDDGWMPGRFDADWQPQVEWSCLTGEAQMANNWMRLTEITGDAGWLEPVPNVLRFLKHRQDRKSFNRGLRGGMLGSSPIDGEYGRYELLNWATKYFADALMRHDAGGTLLGLPAVSRLA
ncbi:MAG: hypothetical protein WEE89_19650 [Gemmatimonadota bacterium]